MSRDDARREVLRALGNEHDTTFAERTGLSLKTVSAFLSGRRWPQRPTLTRMEQALGWDVGRITELAEAPDRQERTDVSPPITTAVQQFPDGLRIVRTVYEQVDDPAKRRLEHALEVFVRTWQSLEARDADEGNPG